MGKKARMRRYPQKFGRKFASHPYARALAKLKEVKEEAMADGVITAEEKLEIAAAEAEVESQTPVLDAVAEELVPEPAVEEVAPEPMVEEKPKPKSKRTRKSAPKKTPVAEESAVKKPAPKRKYTRKKKTEDKE
jgi:outer membrane biosynthesis protein TonB